MERTSKIGPCLAAGYLFLPFVIFVLGWIKIYFAFPIVVLTCFCFYKVCKNMPALWVPKLDLESVTKILIILGFIAIWVYYSGIGKFVWQTSDHTVRNGLFNLLVEFDWPVTSEGLLGFSGEERGLIYYIGFWLPSALVGKALGLRQGYYFQAVWALVGIALVYYLICARAKKLRFWPLWILVFFSGLDIVGAWLTNWDLESSWHFEKWAASYEYSSNTTQLFWVFNQAVPAWLCTILLLVQKNRKNLVFLLASLMLNSTFPFIGCLLLVVFLVLLQKYPETDTLSAEESDLHLSKGKWLKNYIVVRFKDTFTIQNVLGGGIIGITTFLYLIGNISANNIGLTSGSNYTLAKLVIFLLLEFGVYAVLIHRYQYKNWLYYFTIVCLVTFPIFKIGISSDFIMRATIPALFILMLMVIDSLDQAYKMKDKLICGGLVLALLLGSATPLYQMKRNLTNTFKSQNAGKVPYRDDASSERLLTSANFSGETEDNFFFKYLAK